jgi:hypothetical protein
MVCLDCSRRDGNDLRDSRFRFRSISPGLALPRSRKRLEWSACAPRLRSIRSIDVSNRAESAGADRFNQPEQEIPDVRVPFTPY